MLRTKLTHPTILKTLASAGHGSMVLISDGNYPHLTGSHPNAERVYLNLMPGMVKVTDVLEAVISATPVEAAHVMATADGSEPSIYGEFRQMLPGLNLQPVERFAFYDLARNPNVALVIASGDQRLYANILLTVGVVPPDYKA